MKPSEIQTGKTYQGANNDTRKVLYIKKEFGEMRLRYERETIMGYTHTFPQTLENFAAWAESEVTNDD